MFINILKSAGCRVGSQLEDKERSRPDEDPRTCSGPLRTAASARSSLYRRLQSPENRRWELEKQRHSYFYFIFDECKHGR